MIIICSLVWTDIAKMVWLKMTYSIRRMTTCQKSKTSNIIATITPRNVTITFIICWVVLFNLILSNLWNILWLYMGSYSKLTYMYILWIIHIYNCHFHCIIIFVPMNIYISFYYNCYILFLNHLLRFPYYI